MKRETVRASQLNGCAFCVDMHVREATFHSGLTSTPRDGRV